MADQPAFPSQGPAYGPTDLDAMAAAGGWMPNTEMAKTKAAIVKLREGAKGQ